MYPCSHELYAIRLARRPGDESDARPAGQVLRAAGPFTATAVRRRACPWAGVHAQLFVALADWDRAHGVPTRSRVHLCRQCRAAFVAQQAPGIAAGIEATPRAEAPAGPRCAA